MTRAKADAAFKGFSKALKIMSTNDGKTTIKWFGSIFKIFRMSESGTGCNITFGDDVVYIFQRDDTSAWEFKADDANMFMFDAIVCLFVYPEEGMSMYNGLIKRLKFSKI